MHIVVKETDQYKSSIHKNTMLSEYLIYLLMDDTLIKAYIEYGTHAKNERVFSLTNSLDIKCVGGVGIDLDNHITEIKFKDFKKYNEENTSFNPSFLRK